MSVAFPLLVAGVALLAAVLVSGLAILLLAIARRMPLHFRWIAASSFLMVALTCTWMPAAIGWQLGAAVSLIVVAAVLGGAAAVVTTIVDLCRDRHHGATGRPRARPATRRYRYPDGRAAP